MKMELDKKLDTIRLNVLAANFGDLATRRQMIQEFCGVSMKMGRR